MTILSILGFIVVYVIIGTITNLLVVLFTDTIDPDHFIPIGLGWPMVVVFGTILLISYVLFEYIPTKILQFIVGKKL